MRRSPAAIVDELAVDESRRVVERFEQSELVATSLLPGLVWTRGLFMAFEGS